MSRRPGAVIRLDTAPCTFMFLLNVIEYSVQLKTWKITQINLTHGMYTLTAYRVRNRHVLIHFFFIDNDGQCAVLFVWEFSRRSDLGPK